MKDAEVCEQGVAERSVEELGDELTVLAAHLAAGTYRWLVLLAEFDRREGWAGVGVRSCAHWVSWQCGVDLPAAREKVRVARALPGLPGIASDMSGGELSYSMVRALTRVATAESEAELVEMARHGTVSQVERLVKAMRRARDADLLNDARHQLERRHLATYHDEEGSLVLTARLPADAGAVVEAALHTALASVSAEVNRPIFDAAWRTCCWQRDSHRSWRPKAMGSETPDGYPARLADALVLVASPTSPPRTPPAHPPSASRSSSPPTPAPSPSTPAAATYPTAPP